VGVQMNLPPAVVKKVYESVFSMMRHVIKEMPNLKDVDVDDMKELRTNFFIPKFARFYIDIEKIRKKRELKISKYAERVRN